LSSEGAQYSFGYNFNESDQLRAVSALGELSPAIDVLPSA